MRSDCPGAGVGGMILGMMFVRVNVRAWNSENVAYGIKATVGGRGGAHRRGVEGKGGQSDDEG